MKWYRLRFSQPASEALGRLKGRTGLTPNVLARIGFMLSINDPIEPIDHEKPGTREIDRKVLTGEWDDLFTAILKERYADRDLSPEELFRYFRAHMNQGALLLHKRVRNLSDIARLLPTTQASTLDE